MQVFKFWQQKALITIGSKLQQQYITYFCYQLMKNKFFKDFINNPTQNQTTQSDELQQFIQAGIQNRVEKLNTSPDIYQHGLLMWKSYMEVQGLNVNEIISSEDDDEENSEANKFNFDIDIQQLFSEFLQSSQKDALKQLTKDNLQQIDQNQQTKVDMQAKEIPVALSKNTQFYDEQDSDNESDFDIRYEQQQEDFKDLKPIQKPLFIQDLIFGLQSENVDRYNLAIQSSESLIRNQNQNDLDIMCEDLIQLLFRVQNKFNIADFTECKYRSIQALLEKQPKTIALIIVERIQDSEASLGEKLFLIEVLGNSASNLTNEKSQEQDFTHIQSYRNLNISQQEDNQFFETKSLFDEPIQILGTLKRKLAAPKIQKGHINHFHPYADIFIYPSLHLIRSAFVLREPSLMAKALFSLSLMLEGAQNHLKIQQFSQETYQMFQSLRTIHESSAEVTINLIFLLSKLRKLESQQRDDAIEWVHDQLENNGGNQVIQEVGMIVMKILSSSNQ
eukprot:403352132